MSHRLPHIEVAYAIHRKKHSKRCDFCSLEHNEIKGEYTYFCVIENIFPYAFWDGQKVSDHLMIVPRRHIEALYKFTDEEQVEYAAILKVYDQQGYSIYGRSSGNSTKTIPHQHTHLIRS